MSWHRVIVGEQLVHFHVFGQPAPGGSKIAGIAKNGRTFVRDDSKRTAPWREFVSTAAALAMVGQELLEGPLALRVVFVLARPLGHFGKNGLLPSAPPAPIVRPDLTKLIRPVEDAMTGIVWRDDSQVVVQLAEKRYGDPVGVQVTVHRYYGGPA